MESTFTILAREIVEQRVRARRAEVRLSELEETILALGLTIWQTDRSLRLRRTYGTIMDDSQCDCHVEDFCRAAFGASPDDDEPLAAHRDARAGKSVTLNLQQVDRQYAMMIEPKRSRGGKVIGTVGMAVELTAGG